MAEGLVERVRGLMSDQLGVDPAEMKPESHILEDLGGSTVDQADLWYDIDPFNKGGRCKARGCGNWGRERDRCNACIKRRGSRHGFPFSDKIILVININRVVISEFGRLII